MTRYLVALFFLVCSNFASSQTHTVNPTRLYQSTFSALNGRYVSSGTEVCVLNGDLQNSISSPYYYNNPRYTDDANPGCLFDLTSRTNPNDIILNWVGVGWASHFKECPLGYSLNGTQDLCVRTVTSIANKPDTCPAQVGNPIVCSNGAKIEYAQDVLSAALTMKRNFRSLNASNTTPLLNVIGKGWHSDLTRKIVFLNANTTQPVSAMLIRNDGTTMIFTKQTNGSWLPEGDLVRYRLEEIVINTVPQYVLTSPSNHQEIYDAAGYIVQDLQDGRLVASYQRTPAGRLLSIQDANGRTASVAYTSLGLIDTITLPDGQIIDYGYDTSSRLISVNKSNDITTYSYVDIPGGTATYLSGVTHNGVPYANFGYNASAKANLTEHAGGVDRFEVVYSNNDNTATVTTPTGATKVFQFTTVLGSRIPTTWQDSGSGVQTVNVNFAYDANSNVTSKKRDQLLSCHYYDTSGRYKTATYEFAVTTVATCPATQSAAASSTFLRASTTQWDAVLNVATERTVINAANVLEAKTTYAHNARGQVTAMCQIDPNNATAMTYVCGTATNAPVGVRQSTSTYCEAADVTAGTCPIVGLTISSNGPRSEPGVIDVVSYTYYQNDHATCSTAPTTCPYRKGDLWKVTNALNHVTETLAYDGAGRALHIKDANNVITDLQYHARGWLTHRKVRGSDNATEADDAITQMDYDATGQVIKVIQPDGDFINFTYDAAHRLTGITDALNNSITYTLDNAGNRTAETTKDPSNVIKRSLSRVYDTQGRLQQSKNAAGTALATLTYDANDNLNTSTDGLSRITDQDVDPLNRLIRTIQDQGAGKINATTQFEYDARDNLTKVIDPKALNTVYSYNGLNDLTQLSSPDTGSTIYTYDSAGNRSSQTDARNKTSSYEYDVANRLISVSVPTAAQNVSFAYDSTQTDCQVGETFTVGRLARITDESGSTRYCYNRLGQPVRKVQSITNGPNLTLGSTYNAANRTVAMTYPSGAIVTYLRNAKGQITGIDAKPTATGAQVSLVSNATYLPFGPLNTLSFANGRVLTKAYDQNYDIDKVSDNSTTGLSQDSTVNVMGNITAITERTTGTANTTRQFAYDNLDRLLSLKNGATNVQSFTYDATGNRLSKTLATTTTTTTYPATSHRLSNDGTTARTYDNNGNTITTAAKSFVYDDRNRLRDYINSGTTVTRTYRYNGKGERVSKVQAAGHANNRYYFYDEAGHLLGEYLANGTRVQEYVWLDDQLVAVLSDHDASTYQFVETDHLGTPRAVIHPVENNIVWRWNLTNTAFGEHTATNNPDGDAVTYTFNLRYPGQYYDAESTLHYNYFRDYEASTGRYVQSDPIGLAAGMSTYGYVSNRPLTLTDPRGLAETTDTSWCRQNPAACAAIFGGGGAYIVTPKPIAVPQTKPWGGEKCKTCAEEKPEYDECSEISRYYPYSTASYALLDFPSGSKKRPGTPATSGVCAMKGTHHTVFLNGAYVGSIFSCNCCTNTGGGPVIEEKWGNNRGR